MAGFRPAFDGILHALQTGFTNRQDDGIVEEVSMLPAAQERVSYLEGKMDEMSNTLTRVEGLLTSLDHKFMSLDQKVDRRFDSSFMWMFGVQVTTLLTLVAGLFTIIAKLL